MDTERLFCTCRMKVLVLIDVLGGWHKKLLLLHKTQHLPNHKYERAINTVAFSQAIKPTIFLSLAHGIFTAPKKGLERVIFKQAII